MERYLPGEKENKKISVGISVGLHTLLLILFFWLLAYEAPFPPNPGIPGVELNFGLTDAGMGDVQKETTAQTQNTEDSKPEEASSPETTEEDVEQQNTPQMEAAEVEGEAVQTTPVESPHVVNEQSDISAQTGDDRKVTEAVKPKTEKSDKPKDGGNGKSGEKFEQASSSNGDKNVMGDQGKKTGTVDARALYGNEGTGGGGGPKLSIAGWDWVEIPDKVDSSKERGYVIFEFKVDDYGIVEWVRTKETTLSPSVEKFYYNQLMNTNFIKKGNNVVNYVGTVKFEVRAQ